eukprot:m.154051 g.154051  ORF g.154051 m.154051 type:complete len:842 (+) comp30866_c0_seq1:99-2624(+)
MSTLSRTVPSTIPVFVIPGEVLFPSGRLRFTCKPNTPNWNLADEVIWKADRNESSSKIVAVVPGFGSKTDDGSKEMELNAIGTVAIVDRIVRFKNKGSISYTVRLVGLARVEVTSFEQSSPYVIGNVTRLEPKIKDTSVEFQNLSAEFKKAADRLMELLQQQVPLISKFRLNLDKTAPEKLADLVVSLIEASFEEKLAVLNELELNPRFKAALQLLNRQLLVLSAAGSLVGKDRSRGRIKLPNKHRPKAIKGPSEEPNAVVPAEEEEEEDTLTKLNRRILEAKMPPHALRVAKSELKKVEAMERSQSVGPEHQKIVSYIEWLVDLPWARSTKLNLQPDLMLARQNLDNDHYGLQKIKQRIVEYVAVNWLNPEKTATILCLVGPPGVGKTSLGRSIAHTLGREFHRISLGGVHDESDIRGFNRTYVGSQPGRIIQALKDAKSNDPVLLLDEIDKIAMGSSATGNPCSALLEVLDPAQNNTFIDRYINIPFDLSKVLFLATANTIDTIPAPLLDRMEIINIAGYTLGEKLAIAEKYIVPRQMTEHGLTSEEFSIPQNTLAKIGEQYTREAGVRSFERKVAAVCRVAVVKMVENGTLSPKLTPEAEAAAGAVQGGVKKPRGTKMIIKEEHLCDILGPPIFETHDDPSTRVTTPGIAIGLAANAMGGSILYIEATKMPGTGKLQLTGSLGDVIKESAHIALGWIRSHASVLGLQSGETKNFMTNMDIHIHFPEGAVGKDGPSAGVTLTTALVSLLTNRLVRADTAMTGELTLSGTVLPVGGITSKVLAAYRRGIRRICMPELNYRLNLDEIPADVKSDIEFIPAKTILDVLENTLTKPVVSMSKL